MRLGVGPLALDLRTAKMDLAKLIIKDFHSAEAAEAAEAEFERIFKLRETPDAIAIRPVPAQTWKIPRLLVETELASSMAEARRLIEQGGVRIAGERVSTGLYKLTLLREITEPVDPPRDC